MTQTAEFELSPSAETVCSEDPWIGTSWCDDELPTAPAEALAEWLRREPCVMCGRKDAGCVLVYDAQLIQYPIVDDELQMGVVVDDLVNKDELP